MTPSLRLSAADDPRLTPPIRLTPRLSVSTAPGASSARPSIRALRIHLNPQFDAEHGLLTMREQAPARGYSLPSPFVLSLNKKVAKIFVERTWNFSNNCGFCSDQPVSPVRTGLPDATPAHETCSQATFLPLSDGSMPAILPLQ